MTFLLTLILLICAVILIFIFGLHWMAVMDMGDPFPLITAVLLDTVLIISFAAYWTYFYFTEIAP